MINNIKNLYGQLDNKTEFIEALAEEVDLKPSSIATNWFSRFWSIPEGKQARVVELLQKAISIQLSKEQKV